VKVEKSALYKVVSPVCASVRGPVTVPEYLTDPSETLMIVNAVHVPFMVAILSLLGRKPREFNLTSVLAAKSGMTGNANINMRINSG
jgi:hypothetical protein